MGTVGSLFTGCGGLDLGLEAAGWKIAWACENDEACRRVLARRRPDLPVYPDVRQLPYDDLEPVDLLAGGFPCQDLSYAGKGRGLDGERSALWFDYAAAIRVLRPRLVLVENVPGLATRGLGRVVYDLAEAGYVGSWIRLGASDLGAPHRRERIFLLAADAERVRVDPDGRVQRGGAPASSRHASAAIPAGPQVAFAADAEPDGGGAAADTGGERRPRRRGADGQDGRVEVESGHVADRRDVGDAGADDRHAGQAPAWGPYEPAIRRWEGTIGRLAPRPTDDRGRLNPAFVEWMLGFPDGWTDGERRTHRLRMLGNSVQVQCGEYVGAILMEALLAGA